MSKQDRPDQNSNAKLEVVGAVADKDLDLVTGGNKAAPQPSKGAAQDEGPKESITFVYGKLVVQYGHQS